MPTAVADRRPPGEASAAEITRESAPALGVDLDVLADEARSYLRAAEKRDELTSRQVRAGVAKLMGVEQAVLEDPAIKVRVKEIIEKAFLDVHNEVASSSSSSCRRASAKRGGRPAAAAECALGKKGATTGRAAQKVEDEEEEASDAGARGFRAGAAGGRPSKGKRAPARGRRVAPAVVDSESDSDFAGTSASASAGSRKARSSGATADKPADEQPERQETEKTRGEGEDEGDGESSDFMPPPPVLTHSAAKPTGTRGSRRTPAKRRESSGEQDAIDGEVEEGEGTPPRKKNKDSPSGGTKRTRKLDGAAESATKVKRGKSKTGNLPPAVPGKNLDLTPAEAEKVHSLKKFITACGVRKRWGKELEDLDTGAAIIARLKKMLQDLGVQGRPSLAQCQRIKAERELQAEVSAMDASNIIEDVETAKLQRRVKASSWLYPAAKVKDEQARSESAASSAEEGDCDAFEGQRSPERAAKCED